MTDSVTEHEMKRRKALAEMVIVMAADTPLSQLLNLANTEERMSINADLVQALSDYAQYSTLDSVPKADEKLGRTIRETIQRVYRTNYG